MINKIKPITFRRIAEIPKGWGSERPIINHLVFDSERFPTGYSGKLLCYNKKGALSSNHLHFEKWETFFLLSGSFEFRYYDLENADQLSEILVEGDIVDIPPGNPHQLLSLTDFGTIIEFASTDYAWDNYRIGQGDSQTKIEDEHHGLPTGRFKIDVPVLIPKEGDGFLTQNKI